MRKAVPPVNTVYQRKTPADVLLAESTTVPVPQRLPFVTIGAGDAQGCAQAIWVETRESSNTIFGHAFLAVVLSLNMVDNNWVISLLYQLVFFVPSVSTIL